MGRKLRACLLRPRGPAGFTFDYSPSLSRAAPRCADMKNSFAAGLLAAFLAVALWGAQLPIAKDSFAHVDPFSSTALRYLFALLVMVPALIWQEGRGALRYGRQWKTACLLGFIGMAASPCLVFLGMSMSRAEYAVVIVALQPSMAAILHWILQSRRPSSFTLACIAMALAGVVLVVTKGELAFHESARELLGSFCVLLGALAWVIYTMGTGKLAGWSIWRITTLTMLPGGVANMLLAAGLIATGIVPLPTAEALWTIRWPLAYLSFAGVLVSMLAWNFGNQRIGPLNATLFINFMPVMTFGFRSVQGHQFSPIELLGAGLVVAALVANNVYLRVAYLAAQRRAAVAAG